MDRENTLPVEGKLLSDRFACALFRVPGIDH